MDKTLEKLKTLNFENIVVRSSKQVCIKTSKNRVELLHYLAEEFNGVYVDAPSSISSVGYVRLNNNIKLVVKPDKKYSAGVLNEKILASRINNSCTADSINIKFIGKNKIYECKGVKQCKLTGTNTKGRRKADLVLQGDIDYPVSLKKDNAEIWESADNYIGYKARLIIDELVNNGRVELKINNGVYYLKPNIAFSPTVEEKRDVVFGSDILPNGVVVVKSFDSESIISVNKDNRLDIPVTKVITNLNDLDNNDDVVFLVRNDSSRKSKKLGYPGLRVLAVYKSRLTKNILLYDNVVY